MGAFILFYFIRFGNKQVKGIRYWEWNLFQGVIPLIYLCLRNFTDGGIFA